MNTFWEIIKTFIVPIIIAIITVKISLRKFRTEKWWEKKAETYSTVIDSLHKLKNYCEQKLEAEYSGASYGKINFSGEKEAELHNQWKQAHQEVNLIFPRKSGHNEELLAYRQAGIMGIMGG